MALMRKSPLRRKQGLPAPTKPLSRSSAIGFGKPRKPLAKRNRKRQQRELERAYGPAERREWMKRRPCCHCGVRGWTVSAHVGNGGAGRKSDAADTVPLCSTRMGVLGCHDRYDQGKASFRVEFEQRHGFTLAAAAALTELDWKAYVAGRTTRSPV